MKRLFNQSHVAPGELVRAGRLVDLRRHRAADRSAFVRWYRDPEIAALLRHDLAPLTETQARGYFDSIVLPSTMRGTCWAVTTHDDANLIGSTALVDVDERTRSSMFRLVIGEKTTWGRGYGTEATDLVLAEAFHSLGLHTVRLEVFDHNPRARRAYERVGFTEVGSHREWVAQAQREITVLEMAISRDAWMERGPLPTRMPG